MCTRQVAVTSAAEARIRWDANSSRTVQLARAASEDAVLALVRSVWSHILAALTQVRNSAPSSSASLCIAFPVTATRPSSSPRTLSFSVCVKMTATLSLEAQTLDGDESAVVSRALHLLHRWASRFGRSIAAAGRVCPNPPNAYRVAVRMCMCRHRMAFSHGTWALPSASDDSRRAYRSTCTVELLCLAARQRAARACSQFLQALPPHRDQLDGLVRVLYSTL